MGRRGRGGPPPAGRSGAARRHLLGVGHCSTPHVARILPSHRVMGGLTWTCRTGCEAAACHAARLDGPRRREALLAEVAVVPAILAAAQPPAAALRAGPAALLRARPDR